MNITTLLDKIRDDAADDAATKTWCQSNYSKDHDVYIGTDTRKPPGASDFPLVHLFPIGKIGGYELEEQDHIIGATCGIIDDDKVSGGKSNVVEYEGIRNLEAFRKLVETAIKGAADSFAAMTINVLNIEYETIEYFPAFLATMEFKITGEYYQGEDPFD